MGKHKKNPRPKASVTVRDPHYQEYDQQKERNIRDYKGYGVRKP